MANEVISEMLRCVNGAVFDWNYGLSYQIVRIGNKRLKVYITPDLMTAFIKSGYDSGVFVDEAIRQIGRNEAVYEVNN